MDLTWRCHICGDERPDDRISVFKVVEIYNGIEIGQNVRYCNDRPTCVAAAPNFRFLKGGRASG